MMRLLPFRWFRIRCRRVLVKLTFLLVCVVFTWWTIGRMYSLISVQEFYERSYIASDERERTLENQSVWWKAVVPTEISPLDGNHQHVKQILPSKFVIVKSTTLSTEEKAAVTKLRLIAKSFNDRNIHNLNNTLLNSGFKEKGIAIIIQVHDRTQYFEQLINSLRNAKDIENSLLIISHDFYSNEMNNLVKSIDFCQVRQIFFPYSMQLYPDEFPGSDPNDCPRDIKKAQAHEMKCNNAEHPDKYGHYREAKFTMTKHHWWWKANAVFDKMVETKEYDGPILFLEDDHYVSPDFISTLKNLNNLRQSDPACPNQSCDIMTLGTYKDISDFRKTGADMVIKTIWKSFQHNMGMAMTRQTWNKIKQNSVHFCKYDEYNWDWTLMYISVKVLPSPLNVLIMKTPRVFHLGECGLHHKKTKCSVDNVLAKYKKVINDNKDHLFQTSFKVTVDPGSRAKVTVSQPYGGWGDVRDHELCQSFVKETDDAAENDVEIQLISYGIDFMTSGDSTTKCSVQRFAVNSQVISLKSTQ